jgi:Flp pilus assembly CpaE family ATPase
LAQSNSNDHDHSLPREAGWQFPTHVTRELAVMVDAGSPLAQSVFAITSQIQHRHRDFGVRSFCFIADRPQSGVTVIAANVAAAFATTGQRVALIETNFDTPRLAAMLGLERSPCGLSEWLSDLGATGWAGYLQPAYPNLLVMSAGQSTNQASALLATRLRTLILELSRMFDVIICDAPPMNSGASALSVVSAVERTVVVARANQSGVKALVQFEDTVKQCGGTLGGTLYVDF